MSEDVGEERFQVVTDDELSGDLSSEAGTPEL